MRTTQAIAIAVCCVASAAQAQLVMVDLDPTNSADQGLCLKVVVVPATQQTYHKPTSGSLTTNVFSVIHCTIRLTPTQGRIKDCLVSLVLANPVANLYLESEISTAWGSGRAKDGESIDDAVVNLWLSSSWLKDAYLHVENHRLRKLYRAKLTDFAENSEQPPERDK